MSRQKLHWLAAKGCDVTLPGQDARMHLNDIELVDDAPESKKAFYCFSKTCQELRITPPAY